MPTARTWMTLALTASVLVAGGCRGDRSDATPRRFFPDMDDQQKWDPQEATEFFADGRTARPLPDNAVAFSGFGFDPSAYGDEDWARDMMTERSMLLAEDDATFTGAMFNNDGEQEWIAYAPVEITAETVHRGRERFNIYCASCHGYMGDGKGMVGQRWSYPPANLLGELYRDRTTKQGTDGWIYHVIREGVWSADGANRMPGYKHAVDPMDAWAIVSYLRALQRSQTATPDDLTPSERDRLLVGTGVPVPTDDAADTGDDS
jgi:mono/diheme cytochrome c family protein